MGGTNFASRACPVIKHSRKAGPETFRDKEPRNPGEAAVAGHALWGHTLVRPQGTTKVSRHVCCSGL
ncbi:hypothetical protein WJX82_010532 [Trebouxia sp. C0006]